MFKLTLSLAVLLSLIALACSSGTPAVRFVNALEGSTIDIYSSELDTVHLNYMQVDGYQSVSGGSISVTNVVDSSTGNSYTNGQSLLISFDFNATVAVVFFNGGVVLALFNETFPESSLDTANSYVRLIDLSNSTSFITLASTSGSIASYVGSYVCTTYQSVDPSTTSFRIFDSQTQTYNTPSVTMTATIAAGDAYTVFYFTPSSGPAAVVALDRSLTGSASPDSSSGVVVSGSGSSSSDQSTESSNHNSGANIKFFALLGLFSAIFAL